MYAAVFVEVFVLPSSCVLGRAEVSDLDDNILMECMRAGGGHRVCEVPQWIYPIICLPLLLPSAGLRPNLVAYTLIPNSCPLVLLACLAGWLLRRPPTLVSHSLVLAYEEGGGS